MMRFHYPLCYFGFFLAIFSIALLTWGLRAVTYKTRSVSITQSDLSVSASRGADAQSGTNPISGRLNLEWPETIRLGDAGQVRLSFTPAPSAQPTPSVDLILQSRLELAGIIRTPTGEISQALKMDHPVTFLWNLRSFQTGTFTGEVWLYIQQNPLEENPMRRKVVSSQQIECTVNSLAGLSGLSTRILGGVGLVVGVVLGLGEWVGSLAASCRDKKMVSKG